MGKRTFVLSFISLFVVKNLLVQGQRTMTSTSVGLYSVAFVTVPSHDVAKKIAHGLVSNKLAACVNIIPQITSIYEWDNKINEDNELLLMIKTRTESVGNLTEFVKKNHPYKVCEVISLSIDNGNDDYLNWIGRIVPSSKSKAFTTTE